MYHVAVYQCDSFAQTNLDMTPAQDTWLAIQNGHYLPQEQLKLYGGWFGGVNLTALTLVTPRSRMVVPPRLYPIQQALLPPDRPHIWDRRTNPFTLNAVEEISMQANLGGTAAAYTTVVLFMGESLDPAPPGDPYTLHGVSTSTANANAWTQIGITWDQTIPAGTYTVIGTQHQSATAICHRLNFRQKGLRPGFLSLNSLGNMTDPSYYFGGWGSLGTFTTTVYPFFEVFCNGADAAHDICMTMIKTG